MKTRVCLKYFVTDCSWVPSAVWATNFPVSSLHLNPLRYSNQIQEKKIPDLHLVFPKCGNVPNTQNRYSLAQRRPLALINTSLDAKFSAQNFSFADKSNQWVKVLGLAVSLNWGKCTKHTERCIILLTVSL